MRLSSLSEKLFLGILALSASTTISAQEKLNIDADLGGDVVSSYVWRGYRSAGFSVQPSVSVSLSGFTLGAWASTDLNDKGYKEVDFSASYENSGFKIGLTDYWWDGEEAYRYYSTPNGLGHMLEANLAYTLPESFPLSVSWNTFFIGKGNKNVEGDNTFSTYVELAYPFSIKGVDFGISAGFVPWESAIYSVDKFKVTSLQLSASKSIKITDSYSLPIFGNIITNPAQEDIHFVFGVKLF